MDLAAARDLESGAYSLQRLIEQLDSRLPEAGEPPEVYALRARVGSDDVYTATVQLANGESIWVVFVGSVTDKARLYDEVLRPLQEIALRAPARLTGGSKRGLPRAKPLASADDWAHELLNGCAIVFDGGSVSAIEVRSFPRRPIGEPSTEQAILGPKQAFTESIEENIGALRYRIRDDSLRIEIATVGRRSHTKVALAYLADVVNPDLVGLSRRGLAGIDTDFIRNGNDIAEFLFQRSLSPIPLTDETERADRAAAAIAEGRLCLIVDGTPFVILVPITFTQVGRDNEANLPGPIAKRFVRTLRLVGVVLSLSVAGLYTAVLTADTPILPTPLAMAVSASRNGVPYPVLTEVLIMLAVIDVFSEATAQAPGGIGNTLSIVGTLIIGQMAVQARLASSLMMIVVAATALGSFLTLKYPFSYTLRIWKYPIVLLSGIAGLFGWMTGLLLMLTHMASLKSAGVPYLAPAGPLRVGPLLSTSLTRVLKPDLTRRPSTWNVQQTRRANRGRP